MRMGEFFEIKITTYALGQMQETVRYISVSLNSPEIAEKWMQRIRKEISSLSHMPKRISLTEEEPWHSQGIHKMAAGNFLIYFWVDDETPCVWITAVVYGRRDQKRQLEQMDRN